MLHPMNPHPVIEVRDRDAERWPYVIALAVIGPLAIAAVFAVLAAMSG